MTNDRYEDDLMTCVHCGLCLNACPTYLETGSEADSPRGRIVLMRGMHEGTLAASEPDVALHIDRCLGCLACETACPSNVPYGHLIEIARERVNRSGSRSAGTAASRKALLATMTNPSTMELAMRVTGGGVPGFAARMLSADASGSGKKLALPKVIAPPLPPAFTPAMGQRRARVAVLTGCVMRVMFGDVNADTVKVLAANGCEVLVNRRQGCCGALHLHNGYSDEAREMARRLIDAFIPFEGLDAIIVNSAGCGSTLKDYSHVLAGDPRYAGIAEAFASKIKDVSEFLADLGWIAPVGPLGSGRADSSSPNSSVPEGRSSDSSPGIHSGVRGEFSPDSSVIVAYHDACHLAHGQQIREAPRRLLARIPNVKIVPLPESEICCGSAGIYNLTQPEMSQRLQARKVDRILETGASVVATGNPGCLAWIASGLADRGRSTLRVVHPITLLAEAIDA